MYWKIATLILLMTACLHLSSCSLFNSDEPKSELEKLPPVTQTGENTFACLINGKAFNVQNTVNQYAIYQGTLQFGGRLVKDADNDEDVSFYLDLPEIMVNSYDLRNDSDVEASHRVATDGISCWQEAEDVTMGSLTFSRIDRENYIISGTFSFTIENGECGKTEITDGRFDMQYIP